MDVGGVVQEVAHQDKNENGVPRLSEPYGILVLCIAVVCSCFLGAVVATLARSFCITRGAAAIDASTRQKPSKKATDEPLSPPPSAPASFDVRGQQYVPNELSGNLRSSWVELDLRHSAPPVPAPGDCYV